ncbi:hypothetical protein [Roseimaritima sediminicola]|uniref:hypothetical protein n=1 Tax=Roseimaritima sediminicola TaxID=2662066 RepID=UPI0012983BA0|nr:hypothetical protein [Roseimaritima sediminicola]
MVGWQNGWWTAVLLVATLASIGCFEESVVVKVNRDGSGVIHVRSYQQKTKLFSFGSADSSESSKDEEDETVPPPPDAKLQRVAKALGPGVRVQQAVSKTNAHGWKGFEVVFAFDDIDHVVLHDELLELGDDDEEEDEAEAKANDNTTKWLADTRFRLQDDRLVILQRPSQKSPAGESADREPPATTDPFAEASKSGPAGPIMSEAMLQSMAAALKDARVGVFVELEGGIADTDARYYSDQQVTLLKAELGPLLKQPKALEQMKRIEDLPAAQFRAELQELVEEIDGLEVDTNPEISVGFAS